jgi:rhodanese-related sulfurtransferase
VIAYKLAVAIKKEGYTNITIYNGGLKDWVKAGNKIESVTPLPEVRVHFINVDELYTILQDADQQNCRDKNGNALVTLIDFRMSHTLQNKMGADIYQIRTRCETIKAQLDNFIDNNEQLIVCLPETGQIISISETGNRDRFLVQFLSQFGKTNIRALKYGMRSWIKAGYPTEKLTPTDH